MLALRVRDHGDRRADHRGKFRHLTPVAHAGLHHSGLHAVSQTPERNRNADAVIEVAFRGEIPVAA